MWQIYYFSFQSYPKRSELIAFWHSDLIPKNGPEDVDFGLVFGKCAMMFLLQLLFSVFLVLGLPENPASQTTSIDPVIGAIESGSSSDLARYFDSSISLNINGQQGDYSKSQAEIVLKDFFKKNPSMGFTLVFKSESNPSLSSYIGNYESGQGQYKVFIKVNQQDAQVKVYSLGFVKA